MRLYLRKHPEHSLAFSPDFSAKLAKSFALREDHDGRSRLRAIHNNDDALAWRLAMIDQAERSIDAQYYSWRLDTSGLLLIDHLLAAADRGVRVRLLLDDIHTFGIDRQIATLNRHPNIEVRLFNPFTYRSGFKLIRLLELLFDLGRLNHRMHNKLLVVDNLVAIVGGRNIGDEYFGMHEKFVFRDLDLLLAGKCIGELSDSFDVYWNHRHSFTARKLISLRPHARDLKYLRGQIEKRLKAAHLDIADVKTLAKNLLTVDHEKFQSALLPVSASVEVFYDSPAFEDGGGKQTVDALYECSLQTKQQMTIISAYFVPDENLLESMRHIITRGVHIRLYTNSLASIDVTAAFSGYQRHRQRLLDMGVELFEYRAWRDETYTHERRHALHAKSILYDTRKVYVGTLNLDPRSASLNTEIGLLIDSPELANDIRQHFSKQQLTGYFWRIEHREGGHPLWHFDNTWQARQPSRSRWQSISNWLFSLLPIQRHL